MLNAPTLFMNGDSAATSDDRDEIWAVSAWPTLENRRASTSTIPEARNTSLSTRTAATVTTAGWLNPRNASDEGTMPATTRMIRAARATMSYRIRPAANITRVRSKTPNSTASSMLRFGRQTIQYQYPTRMFDCAEIRRTVRQNGASEGSATSTLCPCGVKYTMQSTRRVQ